LISRQDGKFLAARNNELTELAVCRHRGKLLNAKFDIFLRLPSGQPVWIKAVESLEEARRQLAQFTESEPGEYFVFNALSGKIIEGDVELRLNKSY
jgi:hypothetical protein